MPIRLVPMSPARLPAWREHSRDEYEADLIAAGESPQVARRRADDGLAETFPSGVPEGGHAVFDLVDDTDAILGYLWIGPDTSDDPGSWWYWDLFVDADHRGRGIGRAAMRLGEEYARSQGAHTLGLSVFGFNHAARGLYESLGYETVTVKMRKRL